MLAAPDVEMYSVGSGSEALSIAQHQQLDGIVIHSDISDIGPLRLVEELQRQGIAPIPPMILFTTMASTPDELMDLKLVARTSVVKIAHSLSRVLDESVLLMHRDEAQLRFEQRRLLEQLRQSDPTLVGKTVLVVDDDVRNIFALTSLLEDHRLIVAHAENGRAGIELLRRTPNIDLVLMDIMMPEMDGYETMRAIREVPQFQSLPIIALTAKAMKGDRNKCLEAGASDYITKPVDLEQLFSVLRVWIGRSHEVAESAVT